MSVTTVILAVLLAGSPQPQTGTSPRADESSPEQASAPSQPASPPSQPASASSPQQEKPSPPSVDPDELPVSLEKIQRRLAQQPALEVKEPGLTSDRSGLPVFRVRVEADKISIADILGPDFARGPVSYGGMTHQEFLNMVTPRDVQGYAAFSNREGLTVAATSFALQWAVKTAINRFQEARDERAREAARKEVRDALEALRRARLEAGLPGG